MGLHDPDGKYESPVRASIIKLSQCSIALYTAGITVLNLNNHDGLSSVIYSRYGLGQYIAIDSVIRHISRLVRFRVR